MDCREKAGEALRELAGEFGLADLTDPDSIRRRILWRKEEADARRRQLESRIDVYERHRIPHLEQQLHDARLDAGAWEAAARSGERREHRLLWAYVALIVIGVVACIAIPLISY